MTLALRHSNMDISRQLQISLALTLLFVDPSAHGLVNRKANKRVQTGSVTGTYKYVLDSLEVLKPPEHNVRISLTGFWHNNPNRVETRNVGNFDETVPLIGRTATVKIQYGDDPCTITLEFRSNKVIVEQGGSIIGCGFGFNVEVDGTYVKTRASFLATAVESYCNKGDRSRSKDRRSAI